MSSGILSQKKSLFKDETGKVYGRWTVMGPSETRHPKRYKMWLCRCLCGQDKAVPGPHLRSGESQSCGCLHGELSAGICRSVRTTHGRATKGDQSPEYRSWVHMKGRCCDSNDKEFHRYGGRGIKVCQEWRTSFAAFLAYVGPRPSKHHSIDRFPNNDGNYEPGNVRWATHMQQGRNMSRNRIITYHGKTQALCDWIIEFDLPRLMTLKRLLRGWTPEEAFTVSRGTRLRGIK